VAASSGPFCARRGQRARIADPASTGASRELDPSLEQRISARLLDVLIRAGLVLVLAFLCYRIFAPFLPLMAWAIILAVTLYPLQRTLAAKMGGHPAWSATAITLLAIALIVVPAAVLIGFRGRFGAAPRRGRAGQLAPGAATARERRQLPIIGDKVYLYWTRPTGTCRR
jgi:hypothetical protein